MHRRPVYVSGKTGSDVVGQHDEHVLDVGFGSFCQTVASTPARIA
jgi:hypothetical protein